MKRDCRKKPIKTTISCSGDAGFFRKSIIFSFIALLGHLYLSFTVILMFPSPTLRRLNSYQ